MKKTNKFLSVLLALIMIISIIPMSSITASAGATLIWPVPGHKALSWDYNSNHAGIDIADGSIAGADVVAAMSGTVCNIYLCPDQHCGDLHNCSGFGTGLIIRGDDGRWYQYAHMQANSIPANVYYGAYVTAGTKIGKVGTTGNSSGNHLHFQINTTSAWNGPVNPQNESYTDSLYYTISYNANGGVGAPASQTKTHGVDLKLSTTIPTRFGYNFWGWSYTPDGVPPAYPSGGIFTPNKSATLYAIWKPNTYTVVYNANGGTGTTLSSSHQYNSLIQSNGEYYAAFEYMKTGHDLTPIFDYHGTGKYLIEFDLYADVAGLMHVYIYPDAGSGKYYFHDVIYDVTTSWKHYSLVVDVDYYNSSVSQSMLSFYGVYDTGCNPHVKNIVFTKVDEPLTANGFTKTGYSFQGWDTSSTANEVAYTDKQTVKNLTSTNDGTVNLYAVWKANTYTVKYNANGGTGTMSNSSHTYDVSKSLTANNFKRDGYTFLGWSSSSTATTPAYTDKQSVKNLTSTNGGTVNLYAVWQKNPVTVSSISIASKPVKTEYYVGDTFNSSGLFVKVTMSDGTTKTLTSGFTVSSPDMSTAGTKTITVTYSGKTASFTINVREMPVTPDIPDTYFTINIKQPSRTTIRYNDGIILHANVDGELPENASVAWYISNDNFDAGYLDNGMSCVFVSANNGYTTIYAVIEDANGNELAVDSIELRSKAGFFDKIGGFFRSLFGSTKIYEY